MRRRCVPANSCKRPHTVLDSLARVFCNHKLAKRAAETRYLAMEVERLSADASARLAAHQAHRKEQLQALVEQLERELALERWQSEEMIQRCTALANSSVQLVEDGIALMLGLLPLAAMRIKINTNWETTKVVSAELNLTRQAIDGYVKLTQPEARLAFLRETQPFLFNASGAAQCDIQGADLTIQAIESSHAAITGKDPLSLARKKSLVRLKNRLLADKEIADDITNLKQYRTKLESQRRAIIRDNQALCEAESNLQQQLRPRRQAFEDAWQAYENLYTANFPEVEWHDINNRKTEAEAALRPYEAAYRQTKEAYTHAKQLVDQCHATKDYSQFDSLKSDLGLVLRQKKALQQQKNEMEAKLGLNEIRKKRTYLMRLRIALAPFSPRTIRDFLLPWNIFQQDPAVLSLRNLRLFDAKN